MSRPLVEYVDVPVENGSVDSIVWRRIEFGVVCRLFEGLEKGWEERRRIACFMVGWKRPPWGE